jgi:polysaccharide pyruvyl transferase WcaK-like protein
VVLCNDQRDIEYAMSFGRQTLYTSDVYEYFRILDGVSEAISFRVHTSLPLWSLGRPALNLSYDERSESLIDTLDMGRFDLNLIEEHESILEKIESRLESFPDRIEAPVRWQQLRDTQEAGIRRFLNLLEV